MLLKGWNMMRLLRLVLGIIIIGQAFAGKDVVLGILGFLLTGMALLNMGCCGVNGCAVPSQRNTGSKDIHYEEITGK